MSVKQMSMVWDLDLEPNHKIVLLAYADHADDDGDNVYPSLGRMAYKTGYSVDQVRRISRQMVNDGLMELVEKGHGRGNPHRYKLTLEKGSSLPAFTPKREKVASDEKKVASDPIKGSTAMLPEPSVRNHPIEPSESTDSSENAKPESLANYHMKRIYDAMKKANYTITGKSKNGNGENEYGRLVSRVQWMLDNMSPTDEELEGLPDSYVRAYTIRGAATDAVYALNELRRQKARDEVMSETKPASWEPVNPASEEALKAKEKPRNPIWYASVYDVDFETVSRWVDEGATHSEIETRLAGAA